MVAQITLKRYFNFGIIALVIALAIAHIPLNAQTTVNFSGNWELDKTASKLSRLDVAYDGTVILEIIQTGTSISFAETYSKPGAQDWKTSSDTYKTDGKEIVTKNGQDIIKKTAQWSTDRKKLVITNLNIQTNNGKQEEYLTVDSYTLSVDGKTLTLEKHFKNPVTGELNSVKVYHKK